ncbi:MAG: hypothetical protein JW739_08430 [Opitutales bacterium]|nr:hypothetical protein [Opitutales bacterium]
MKQIKSWKKLSFGATLLSLCCFISHAALAESDKTFSLKFNPGNYTKEDILDHGKTIRIRSYKYLIYVAHPVDVDYQYMHFYVPEAYFRGKSVNGYTAQTAPVFFVNSVGGYMPAEPATPEDKPWDFSNRSAHGKGGRGGPPPGKSGAGGFSGSMSFGGGAGGGSGGGREGGGPSGGAPDMGAGGPGAGMPPEGRPPMGNMPGNDHPNAVFEALAHGYVVAAPGARGRNLQNEEGNYYGKAPAAIIDLKAAVRYLHYNDKLMPGDAQKIISNGTGSGGSLSALLGATGDHPDYELYLRELGAAEASDAVFAASCYCPITDLEHADMSYEWLFNEETTYPDDGYVSRLGRKEKKISGLLKEQFPPYLNSLGLKTSGGQLLSLDASGNGSFKDYLISLIIDSAQKALSRGLNLSQYPWIHVENGTVVALDFDAYIHFAGRKKTPPAFDSLKLKSPENSLFGTDTIDALHFTAFSAEQSRNAPVADSSVIKMMNPLYYIGQPGSLTAPFWRIRHGTLDRETSLAIPLILATDLENNGASVDMEYAWGQPHSGDYDLPELFTWVDSLCSE